MVVSDSKYRVSRLKTRNRTRNRSRCSNQVRIGLGIGLEVQDWSVSDSKSSLENGDSGNSALNGFLLLLVVSNSSKCNIGNSGQKIISAMKWYIPLGMGWETPLFTSISSFTSFTPTIPSKKKNGRHCRFHKKDRMLAALENSTKDGVPCWLE